MHQMIVITVIYYPGPNTIHVLPRLSLVLLSSHFLPRYSQAKKRIKESNGAWSPECEIRFIANAAGALLPAVANDMKDLFGAVILPGYGMTEAMPISAPPQDYKLDRPGTSGIAIGPELMIVDDQGEKIPRGDRAHIGDAEVDRTSFIGNIVVRGCPVFNGYENNEEANKKSFFSTYGGNWFNTGDMGWMDHDGYLYITGRSKEVINRGGEIISPFEIEECVVQHPRVLRTISFAMPHDTLDETIGIVVVPVEGMPRPDLTAIQKFAANMLHVSKWPQTIVYMTDIPKGQTGKPQRIRLAQRMGIARMTDAWNNKQRHFEADCPKAGTSLKEPVKHWQLEVDPNRATQELQALGHDDSFSTIMELDTLKGRQPSVVSYVTPSSKDNKAILASLRDRQTLHDYEMPLVIMAVDSIPRNAAGAVDVGTLERPSAEDLVSADFVAPRNQLEEQVQKIWLTVLDTKTPISVTADFFEVGGDSLLAGQLASMIRKEFRVNTSVTTVFSYKTIEAMTQNLLKQIKTTTASAAGVAHLESDLYSKEQITEQAQTADDPKAICTICLQLLPMAIIYPIRRISVWFAFVLIWSFLLQLLTPAVAPISQKEWECQGKSVANAQVELVTIADTTTPTCIDDPKWHDSRGTTCEGYQTKYWCKNAVANCSLANPAACNCPFASKACLAAAPKIPAREQCCGCRDVFATKSMRRLQQCEKKDDPSEYCQDTECQNEPECACPQIPTTDECNDYVTCQDADQCKCIDPTNKECANLDSCSKNAVCDNIYYYEYQDERKKCEDDCIIPETSSQCSQLSKKADPKQDDQEKCLSCLGNLFPNRMLYADLICREEFCAMTLQDKDFEEEKNKVIQCGRQSTCLRLCTGYVNYYDIAAFTRPNSPKICPPMDLCSSCTTKYEPWYNERLLQTGCWGTTTTTTTTRGTTNPNGSTNPSKSPSTTTTATSTTLTTSTALPANTTNGITAVLRESKAKLLWGSLWPLVSNVFGHGGPCKFKTCGDGTTCERSSDCESRFPGRFIALVLAIVLTRFLARAIMPLVAIMFKWLIIGRYRAGQYRIWGCYYLRWWMVEQIQNICGRGLFANSATGLRLYYRMLGAKLGENVQIHPDAVLGEPDLLEFGDNVMVDAKAVCKPMCLDTGSMFLGQIVLGRDVIICKKATVAPLWKPTYNVPPGYCIGPLSSSYELDDAKRSNREYCSLEKVAPNCCMMYFVGYPLILFCFFFNIIPALSMLYAITRLPSYHVRATITLSLSFPPFPFLRRTVRSRGIESILHCPV